MAGERAIRIDLGYHGKHFYGSQSQPGVRTVQDELEAAVQQVTRKWSRITLAGRTDRGVHAVGQVASGNVNWPGGLEKLRYALDSVTDKDLVIYGVSDVDESFHARFSAVRRSYHYWVFAHDRSPVLLADSAWWLREAIDLERLNVAARSLLGEQDVRSFAGKGIGSGERVEGTVRRVDQAEWVERPLVPEPAGRLLEFRISANAFLPHMVRNIVGALVEVGAGRQSTSWMNELIDRRDRRSAPPPAPPEGLVLWSVEYGGRR